MPDPQEMPALPSKARAKKFISIIAARQLKNHLNASEGKRAPSIQVSRSPRRSRSLLRRRERSAADASELSRGGSIRVCLLDGDPILTGHWLLRAY